ncbi:MAG: DUF2059 domain-containing protein [Ferruginibacter sp.]
MKQIILGLLILFTVTSPAQAQNEAKKEKIKLLFIEMHQDSLMIKTLDNMTISMTNQMSSIFKDSAYKNTGIDHSKMIEKLMTKNLQRSKENAMRLVNEDMVDIYDKYFSMEEIDDFRNFYKSRSGQKLLDKMPDITKDIMTVMTTKYQTNFQQSLMKDVEEIMKENTQ